MSTITNIPACSALAPFVRNYQLLEFNTDHLELIKPWHAIPEMSLIFFLADKPIGLTNEATGYHIDGSYDVWAQGLSTRFNGLMKFNGNYRIFIIQFMPNGFTRLFNLPVKEFTNKLVEVNAVFGIKITILLEQLQYTRDIKIMAELADIFLKTYSMRQKSIFPKDNIAFVSQHILQIDSHLDIKRYAQVANMSPRNFERRFKEQVGTSPKLFCRSIRFNHAVNLKIISSEKSWTKIAYECGYYDQMHLIKDFKKFADVSPRKFFENTPPPPVQYKEAERNL
jgi:AraC-like DNA-binding protein